LTVARISRRAGIAEMTVAKSAAMQCQNSKQWRIAVTARPIDEAARRAAAARPRRFHLMRTPLPFFPAQSLQERRAANQRAALISAANATSCLPPNGYMDATQPLEYDYSVVQPDDEPGAAPIIHRTRRIDPA
jgi:hypothetical protein